MLGRHFSRCFLAGLVALLPVGGLILAVLFMEDAIASSWLAEQPYYLPGLGLLVVCLAVYLIGLVITSFLGRWLWSRLDALIDALPAVGRLYQTLKQILGYGEGEGSLFREVVAVPGREPGSEELGLVTQRLASDGDEGEAGQRLAVFVPGAPNPTQGRLIYVRAEAVRRLDVPVNDALSALLAVGSTDLELTELEAADRAVAREEGSPAAGDAL